MSMLDRPTTQQGMGGIRMNKAGPGRQVLFPNPLSYEKGSRCHLLSG
jgi:hypothetical protein